MTTTTRVALTRIPDSWAWMAPDLLRRLLPFALVVAVVEIGWRPSWLGVSAGRPDAQLAFAAFAAPVLFVAAMAVQLWLARRRGALSVPAGRDDAWFQAGFYALNGPIEEAFFRASSRVGWAWPWVRPSDSSPALPPTSSITGSAGPGPKRSRPRSWESPSAWRSGSSLAHPRCSGYRSRTSRRRAVSSARARTS